MATHALIEPQLHMSDIPEPIRSSFDVRETESEFLVRTFSGGTLSHSKSSIHHWWQLMSGVWDNAADTTAERRRDRDWELAHEKRKFGE